MLDARISCAIRYDPDHASVNSLTSPLSRVGLHAPHAAGGQTFDKRLPAAARNDGVRKRRDAHRSA